MGLGLHCNLHNLCTYTKLLSAGDVVVWRLNTGRFGNTTGLQGAACSGACSSGYVCTAGSVTSTAAPCGSATLYCPGGSGAALDIPVGWYSTPETADAALRSGGSPCVPGEYCVLGERRNCSGGSYSAASGLTSCDRCPPGEPRPQCDAVPRPKVQ